MIDGDLLKWDGQEGEDMDLLKLKYFHTVALLGNMTRAAEALHISQPSLSIMIRKLEEEIGVPLFDRVGRGIVLNSYGDVLLEHTTRMINELDKANYEIDIMKKGQERAINICGNVESLTSGMINHFFKKTSDYRVRQRLCTVPTAEALLLKKDYQFAITMPALHHEQIKTSIICSGGYLLATCHRITRSQIERAYRWIRSSEKDLYRCSEKRALQLMRAAFMKQHLALSPI